MGIGMIRQGRPNMALATRIVAAAQTAAAHHRHQHPAASDGAQGLPADNVPPPSAPGDGTCTHEPTPGGSETDSSEPFIRGLRHEHRPLSSP